MAAPEFRMDFVKPDRCAPLPATFRTIATAQRGIGALRQRVAIVPRMGPAPDTLRVPIGATELGCVRWRAPVGSPVVVAVHGITANAWSWGTVAEHVKGELALVAVDLRGRGSSSAAPPPFGIRAHADDVAAVIARLGAAPAVVVGHSMGAHVALMCAERHPDAVAGLVLVDGGPPLDVDSAKSTDESLDELLGPSIARLRKVWPDRVTYHAMWSAHPAFAEGLTPDMERYVLSDLAPCEGGFRSIVSEQAVRTDGTELLTDPEVRGLFDRRREPLCVIRAETGIMAVPPPFVDARFVEEYPQHDWRFVPGSNHYSVLFGDPGAAEVADALRRVSSPW
jgi:pimeloyl-ACP methyl ester carboxylesterase